MEYQNSLAYAKQLDEKDPLKGFRDRFFIPQHNGQDCVYFTGNSLGLQPKSTSQYLQQELDDWARMGVKVIFKHEIHGCLTTKVFQSNYQRSSVAKKMK